MLSVFTPTHDCRWLEDVYKSLQAQTYQDFEWVLVPNGKIIPLMPDGIPAVIRKDPKVRIIATDAAGVGALKRFACGECKGDVFVELDHDDQLTPDALETIHKAYQQTPGGFYFSDFVSVRPDGRSEVYGSAYGWERYQFTYDNEELSAMRSFEATARALSEIYFAPNHVRAWSKTAYAQSGGHDGNMRVGDDHDLICRTYVAGVPFVHLPKVLYVYRSNPGSTCKTDNAKVQEQQRANQARYQYPLIYEECRRRQLPMYDLGHAGMPKQGFEGMPVYRQASGVLRFDLINELPANSVGCFWAADVLQRIPMSRVIDFLHAVYKALVPGGWLLCQTPAIDDGKGLMGRGAFQDPGHVSFWSQNTPWYFTHRDYAKHIRGYTARFQLARCWTDYPGPWHKANYIPYVNFDLYALKGQRAPGLVTI